MKKEMKNAIKRPFTLLCLSDLHYSEEGGAVLRKLRQTIKEMMNQVPQWKPDFIVVAGDLVHHDQKDKYSIVRECLDDFIGNAGFHLDRFHVIAVPGNHDKDIPCMGDSCYEKGPYKACGELKKNNALKNSMKEDKLPFKLEERYEWNFKSFGNFYKPYLEVEKEKKDVEFLFPKEILGKDTSNVATTSGLKVFHNAKICFLCINTEWTYFPTKNKTKDYDDGFLCAPLIYSSLKTYKDKYRDYTLVTVMHRNPADLPWETRFQANPYKPDILRHLYQFSDVILTGHNHIERMQPPHRMENHAQLIQLGSSSIKSGNNHLQQYYASMIRIDPIAGKLNTCTLRYDHAQDIWEPLFDKKDYPVAHYTAMLSPDTSPSVAESIVIPLSSYREKEIHDALTIHFPFLKQNDYQIHCININEKCCLPQWILDTFHADKETGEKTAFFLYSLSKLDHGTFVELKKKLLGNKDFRVALYRKKCLLMEVWFKGRNFEADLDYPSYIRPIQKRNLP
jgi:predicted phosphodiesterase